MTYQQALRFRRRDRGSALLLATILIFLTISLTAVLMGSPQADLQRTTHFSQAEKSTTIADAGVRDAIIWLNTYQAKLSNWLPDPDAASGTARASAPTYRVLLSKTTPATTLASPIVASTGFSPALPTPGSSPAPASWWTIAEYSGVTMKNGFPVFQTGNYVSFGGGQYAYMVRALGNGHYEVNVEGRTTGTAGVSANAGRFSTVRIRAVVSKPINLADTPAATTFANPNNGNWVNSSTNAVLDPVNYYFTQTGGGGPSPSTVTGNDIDGVQNTTGAAYQNQAFNNANPGTVAGSPATSTTTGTNAMFTNVDKIVELVEQTPASATVKKYYWGATAPSGYTGATTSTIDGAQLVTNSPAIHYIKIPDGTTVSAADGIFRVTGSAQLQGIVVIDVGNNVTFTTNPVYKKNGNGGGDTPTNGGIKGAFIFYQRGTIKIPPAGFYLFEKTGNAGYHFAWSSSFYTQALQNLPIQLKISSYVVLDG